MADSLAEEYFAKYTGSDAANVLSCLPTAPQKTFEDNWLDFKNGEPGNDDKIREIWSKAAGAMANAGGGVIIWGLVAEKYGDPPVDAVKSVKLVPNAEAFASKLIEAQHFITDPPLRDVQIKPIPVTPGAKEGFVVCLIPEGKTKPYQSLKAKRPFYFRFGDESKEPPLPLLRQLFYPQISTRAKIDVTAREERAGGFWEFKCAFENTGLHSIEYGCLRIQCPHYLEVSQLPENLFFAASAVEHNLPHMFHPGREFNFIFNVKVNQGLFVLPVSFLLFQRNHGAKSTNFELLLTHRQFKGGDDSTYLQHTVRFD